ncbi:MAG: hypothetical protein MUF15_23865 [Acidobacteria bacterium]|nr:hypothetical protein [Acidobacteriota bacterium]
MKIVINSCFGGFGLSSLAIKKYCELIGKNKVDIYDIPRDDKNLIKIVEELGAKASGKSSNLRIVNIPDDVEWEIEEHDGIEWVSEKHRTWN